MSKVFLTSDTHFGHTNIISFCGRPFASVEEMDDALIKNWNSVVSKEDTVYHLGDFAFYYRKAKLEGIFNNLNGLKCLILGNHDKKPVKNLGWHWVKESYTLKHGNSRIHLCHNSKRSWDAAYHGVMHAFGHSHGGLEPFGKSCDVGVDSWNFTPVLIEDLISFLDTLPINVEHDGSKKIWKAPINKDMNTEHI